MTATVDLRPGKLNLRTERGDTVGIPILIQEDGVPANLTGRSYAVQIRRGANSTTAVDVDIDLAEADDGIVTLRLDPAITETLSGDFLWDLQQTYGGTVRTLLAGRWTFAPDVTRDE